MKLLLTIFVFIFTLYYSIACTHTIRLTDTYGDGWNGGLVKVQVNGVDVLTSVGSTFTSGYGPVDLTFSANQGETITVIRTTDGSYPSEMRVRIIDGVGMDALSIIQPTTGAGVSCTANCTAPTAPGGVYVGLQTWMKANSGITGTTPITAVSNQYSSGSGISIHGSPNLENSATTYNYNPYIDLTAPVSTLSDGWGTTRQFLYLTSYSAMNGIDYVALFWTAHLTDLTRENTHLATVENVTNGSPGNGTMHGYDIGSNAGIMDGGYDAADFGTTAAASTWQRNGSDLAYNAAHTSIKQIISARCTSGGSTTLNCFFGGQRDQVDPNSFAGNPRDWKGPAAELIGYTSTITATERQKIHTYLAVKYGVTLSTDYLSTSGSTIFSTASPYNSNIIGIGRDDAEALNQKQSHNDDDSVRVYISSVAASNSANGGTISSDISYLMIGANTGVLYTTAAADAEIPGSCSLYTRMAREWKVTKTNFSQSFNLDVKLPAGADPGTITVSDLRLIIDDDGDFSSGTTSCYYNGDGSGITITYSNPTITISGISDTHIANNSTKFMTIGTVSISTPLPIELLSFEVQKNENKKVNVKWVTVNEINNHYFLVEKLIDKQWIELRRVEGAGNSNKAIDYLLIDANPEIGVNYYRLKQVDYNENYTISEVKSVLIESDLPQIFPNPSENIVNVKLNEIEHYKITFINMLGEEVQPLTMLTAENTLAQNSLSF
ncbi:MAG: hypothetical protein HYR91_08875 [Flavobacteriia bacterium]|nr:hypothetical protein [Flavobacteriia bacterium]